MARQYNKLTIVGNLGKDPEMRFTSSGTPVTDFTIASHDQYTNAQEEAVKTTTWYKCTAWGRLAEICNQYLHKGDLVLLEGKLSPDSQTGKPRIWTRQDGSPAADYEVTVREIYFLPNPDHSQPS